jgi:hypothetical protein
LFTDRAAEDGFGILARERFVADRAHSRIDAGSRPISDAGASAAEPIRRPVPLVADKRIRFVPRMARMAGNAEWDRSLVLARRDQTQMRDFDTRRVPAQMVDLHPLGNRAIVVAPDEPMGCAHRAIAKAEQAVTIPCLAGRPEQAFASSLGLCPEAIDGRKASHDVLALGRHVIDIIPPRMLANGYV